MIESKPIVENEFPIVIDTFPTLLNTQYDFEGMPRAKYQPYYFGGLTDSIKIGEYLPSPPPRKEEIYKRKTSKTIWNQFDDYFVYYSQKMPNHISDTSKSINIDIDNQKVIKECCPTFVTNNFSDIIVIGNNRDGLSLIMQALNEKGIGRI